MQRVRNFTLKDCLVVTVLMACVAALSFPGIAQTAEIQSTPITDTDVQLLRQDIQAQKNQIIGDTMTFTESEAAGFWPVYKDYAAAQHAIADKRIADIKGYAASYDKMDDAIFSPRPHPAHVCHQGRHTDLEKGIFSSPCCGDWEQACSQLLPSRQPTHVDDQPSTGFGDTADAVINGAAHAREKR